MDIGDIKGGVWCHGAFSVYKKSGIGYVPQFWTVLVSWYSNYNCIKESFGIILEIMVSRIHNQVKVKCNVATSWITDKLQLIFSLNNFFQNNSIS